MNLFEADGCCRNGARPDRRRSGTVSGRANGAGRSSSSRHRIGSRPTSWPPAQLGATWTASRARHPARATGGRRARTRRGPTSRVIDGARRPGRAHWLRRVRALRARRGRPVLTDDTRELIAASGSELDRFEARAAARRAPSASPGSSPHTAATEGEPVRARSSTPAAPLLRPRHRARRSAPGTTASRGTGAGTPTGQARRSQHWRKSDERRSARARAAPPGAWRSSRDALTTGTARAGQRGPPASPRRRGRRGRRGVDRRASRRTSARCWTRSTSKTGATVTYTSTGDDIVAPSLDAADRGRRPARRRDAAAARRCSTSSPRRARSKPIEDVAGTTVDDNYAPIWRSSARVDGKLYGV